MGEKFVNHFNVSSPISPFIPCGRGVITNSVCKDVPTDNRMGLSHVTSDYIQGVGRGLFIHDPQCWSYIYDTQYQL